LEIIMKNIRILSMALLMALLLLAPGSGQAMQQSDSRDVDGTVWSKSTTVEKRSFLFGAGNMVALEYSIRMNRNEQPSKFVRGWVEVFKDRGWGDLEQGVDQYYVTHPDRMNEHVFHVIWTSMIKPYLKD
jgi:hypothetical protein